MIWVRQVTPWTFESYCIWLMADSWAFVVLVDDDFIRCLFDIIEDLSYDVTDPYHYPVIRVLVSLCSTECHWLKLTSALASFE